MQALSRTRPSDALSGEQLRDMYRTMLEIREFEEEVHRRFLEGLVHGTTHLCQGQEAVSVGVMSALGPDDYITVTYRGHGHCLARGVPMEAMFAELFGRSTGICKGKGGSMHLQDASRGIIGAFAIVGAGIPAAVGAAMSAKLRGEPRVAVSFFGDGASNIGAFHEALNIASVWKAPAIFVCENNLYGEYSRINKTTPFEDLARRGEAYAMESRIVDGNDVLAVYDAAVEAVQRARSGLGPTFLECKTYRHKGHSRTDPARYRPEQEVREWLARDPIVRLRNYLLEKGWLTQQEADAMLQEVRARVKAASEAAARAPWPDLSELTTHVLA